MDVSFAARPPARSNRVAFFTTDAGYLVPTLVAALQVARQALPERIADVMVFLVGIDDADRVRLQESFPDLMFCAISSQKYALPDAAHFNATHVPRSTLARLVAPEFIPSSYLNLIYLDGDIQVVGDLRPLLTYDVPEGKMLAAPDIAELIWPERGVYASAYRSYLAQLGLERGDDYFNAGVLAARRETWLRFGRDALSFMIEHSVACRYHDQSALNRVVKSSRLFLSPRYNYNTWYQELLQHEPLGPALLHFTGGTKPWADDHPAQEGVYREQYLELVAAHEVLVPFWHKTSGRRQLSPPGRASRPRSSLLFWREPFRRRRARRLLSQTRFALA